MSLVSPILFLESDITALAKKGSKGIIRYKKNSKAIVPEGNISFGLNACNWLINRLKIVAGFPIIANRLIPKNSIAIAQKVITALSFLIIYGREMISNIGRISGSAMTARTAKRTERGSLNLLL